jgi:hypothetical protein
MGNVSRESAAVQPPATGGEDLSASQPMTFQERIEMERQCDFNVRIKGTGSRVAF